jgi:hypothetical protein
VLGYVDLSGITQNISVDSDTIMEMRDYIQESTGNSFRYTAMFFNMVPASLLTPFVLSISAICLYIFMKNIRRTSGILIAIYITLPGILLFMTRPQKETIVLIMTVIVLWTIRSIRSFFIKICIVSLIYFIYAIFMRQYYFIILAVFLLFIFSASLSNFLRTSNGAFLTIIIPLIIISLMIVPESIFIETQGARDLVNQHYDRESRTAFLNPFPTTNGLYFILNYLYSFLRLNFSIFFTFSYKEIFHMASIFFISRLFIAGFKEDKYSNAKICTQLSLSHILVLMIFEPDIGSYLRHVTSIFVYFTPMIILCNMKKTINKA